MFRELAVTTWSGHDEDGFPQVAFDSHGEPGSDGKVAAFELQHTFGFVSRPRDPEVDEEKRPIPGKGCSIFVGSDGDDTRGMLGFDPRYIPSTPRLTKGSSAQYSATGSFFVLDGDNANGTATWYVPIPGSSPPKAHAITVGQDGNGKPFVGFVQSNGLAITMLENSMVLKNASGSTYVEINDAGVVISGNVRLNGGAILGSDAAVPLVTQPGLAALLTEFKAQITAAIVAVPFANPAALSVPLSSLATAGTTLTKGT
jgi:hypothetical protein